MSKINDELINKYSNVIDNYFEHSQHYSYDEHCSECFKEEKESSEYDDGQGRSYDILDSELD